MRFPAKITSSCIWVAIPVGWVILHWYACGADGRLVGSTVTWLPKFLGWVDYQIFLPMVLRFARFVRVELRYECSLKTVFSRYSALLDIGEQRREFLLSKAAANVPYSALNKSYLSTKMQPDFQTVQVARGYSFPRVNIIILKLKSHIKRRLIWRISIF